MASAAEQLAANMNWGAFSKATELKRRIWFTLGALIVARIGAYITIPGIDSQVFAQIFAQHSGGVLGMVDMFAGGAVSRMTIFALGIMPYISASIIMQLLTSVSPQLEALKKEGEAGRKKNQSIYPVGHRCSGLCAGMGHCQWVTGFGWRLGRSSSGVAISNNHSHYLDRGDHLFDVARRTDYGSWHW